MVNVNTLQCCLQFRSSVEVYMITRLEAQPGYLRAIMNLLCSELYLGLNFYLKPGACYRIFCHGTLSS